MTGRTPLRPLRSVTRILRRLVGKGPCHHVQASLPSETLGSDYGGYCVCPIGLGRDSVVYSFGIGEDASFDVALIERFGVTVDAFDPTPRSIAWVGRQELPGAFRFHGWGLAAIDGRCTFFAPDDPAHVSHSPMARSGARAPGFEAEVFRLTTIMRRLGHERLDVLKMDIEGGEYAVLDDLLDAGVRPGQLLVEFHHSFRGVGLKATDRAIVRLNAEGYRIFHVSATGREYSLMHERTSCDD